jgi:hypothetical protein
MREETMKLDRQDRATVHAALLLAIDITKNELAGANGENPADEQRRASAERLVGRFRELLKRLHQPPDLLIEAPRPLPDESAPFHGAPTRDERAPHPRE